MFEADYVSSLGVPSLCKLCCGWYGSEPYTIWPEGKGRKEVGDYEQVKPRRERLQFAFPLLMSCATDYLSLSISKFLWGGKRSEQKCKMRRCEIPCVSKILETFRVHRNSGDLSGWYPLLPYPQHPERTPPCVSYLYIPLLVRPQSLSKGAGQYSFLRRGMSKSGRRGGEWQCVVPRKEYRSWKVPRWLGTSNAMYLKFVQSMSDRLALLETFKDSWNFSLPNLK